jgi:hypothetical protein
MRRVAWPLAFALLASVRARGSDQPPDVRLFFEAASPDDRRARDALAAIGRAWKDDYTALIVDLARFMRSPRRAVSPGERPETPAPDEDEPAGGTAPRFPSFEPPSSSAYHPSMAIRARLTRFLEERTGHRFGDDLPAWRRWIWSRAYEPHPDYLPFKAVLYANVDRRMAEFFAPGSRALIRLDEVDWGGVGVNRIPPLDHPAVVPAGEARFLKDGHVVFGVFVNGEARAYPKRILAWHELARDRVGGVELTVVYCTLCGTVIPYRSEAGGKLRKLGTSGLLYRSNKLMFDEETMSLWSTLEGRPVIGPLAGSGVELTAYPVVTTTWREWRAAHPATTVLSLDTGFDRDYSEGAAYRDYFATDRLMFAVPREDRRLKNKAEVLALLLPAAGSAGTERRALAIAADFLRKNPVHAVSFAGHDLLVVTSPDGANRVYEAAGRRFARRLDAGRLADVEGRAWRVTEEALVPEADDLAPLARVPARRAFWFGWQAQFPDTELVR